MTLSRLVLRCFAVVTAIALATGFSTTSSAQTLADIEKEQKTIFSSTAPSVVFITKKDGFGSGFFVSRDGLILTNAHVVRGADTVKVVTHGGQTVDGNVVERAKRYDLALVKTPVKDARPLKLAGMDQLEVGSWVASVGHGSGGIWTFNTGLVSNIYPSGRKRPVFQTQIPLNPGNSGGPVVDRFGRVVGVVTAGITEANSINFAIPVEIAMVELEGLAKHCDCLVVLAPKKQPVFVDGSMVGKGPRVVVPARKKTYEVFVVDGGKMNKKKITWPKTREVDLR